MIALFRLKPRRDNAPFSTASFMGFCGSVHRPPAFACPRPPQTSEDRTRATPGWPNQFGIVLSFETRELALASELTPAPGKR